ncbi:MAG: tetratricopeptide repeat protein [Candidatus Cloacimonetes bacterium]|nr:tetratricopeptide repeat protein [Candidatus Cloacimonadota bacterium]
MSSSSSTIPVKKNAGNSENKFIRYCLISIWGTLLFFGFISFFQPQWLVDISSEGKKSEALDLRNYGDVFLKKRNYKAAIIQYKKAIKIQPDLVSAIGNLGVSYTQLEQYDEAIKIFEYLLKIDDKNTHINYYNLAELYKRKNDAESTIKYYLKSTETNPYPLHSYQYLGDIYLKLSNWEMAIKSFELALTNRLTLENSYYGLLKSMKIASTDEPEIQEAVIAHLEQTADLTIYDNNVFVNELENDKEIAKTYNFLGYAFHRNNQFKKAKENYDAALNIWPNYEEAKLNLNKLVITK